MSGRIILAAALVALICGFCLAQDKAMTSDEILMKASEVYKNMTTYYEEGQFEAPGEDGMSSKYTIAFKRPDIFKWEMAGEEGGVFYHKDNETVMYDSASQECEKSEGDLQSALEQLPIVTVVMKFAADPYEYIKANTQSIGDAAEADYNGKKVYSIALADNDEATYTCFFDKDTFYMLGIEAEREGEKMSMKSDKLLVNEVPKDASGKEMDVFTFTVPEGAIESSEPEEEEIESTELTPEEEMEGSEDIEEPGEIESSEAIEEPEEIENTEAIEEPAEVESTQAQ